MISPHSHLLWLIDHIDKFSIVVWKASQWAFWYLITSLVDPDDQIAYKVKHSLSSFILSSTGTDQCQWSTRTSPQCKPSTVSHTIQPAMLHCTSSIWWTNLTTGHQLIRNIWSQRIQWLTQRSDRPGNKNGVGKETRERRSCTVDLVKRLGLFSVPWDWNQSASDSINLWTSPRA